MARLTDNLPVRAEFSAKLFNGLNGNDVALDINWMILKAEFFCLVLVAGHAHFRTVIVQTHKGYASYLSHAPYIMKAVTGAAVDLVIDIQAESFWQVKPFRYFFQLVMLVAQVDDISAVLHITVVTAVTYSFR